MKKGLGLVVVLLGLVVLIGCKQQVFEPEPEKGGETKPPEVAQTRDFGSPEEILKNPEVVAALARSDELYGEFPLHVQRTPPDVEGVYQQVGTIVGTDPPGRLSGTTATMLELFNQTAAGRISAIETPQDSDPLESDNLITGSDGSFTIWNQAETTVPGGIVYGVSIVSGTPLGGGWGLRVLTVLTENPQAIDIGWWLIEGTLTPTFLPSMSNLSTGGSGEVDRSMSGLLFGAALDLFEN